MVASAFTFLRGQPLDPNEQHIEDTEKAGTRCANAVGTFPTDALQGTTVFHKGGRHVIVVNTGGFRVDAGVAVVTTAAGVLGALYVIKIPWRFRMVALETSSNPFMQTFWTNCFNSVFLEILHTTHGRDLQRKPYPYHG